MENKDSNSMKHWITGETVRTCIQKSEGTRASSEARTLTLMPQEDHFSQVRWLFPYPPSTPSSKPKCRAQFRRESNGRPTLHKAIAREKLSQCCALKKEIYLGIENRRQANAWHYNMTMSRDRFASWIHLQLPKNWKSSSLERGT